MNRKLTLAALVCLTVISGCSSIISATRNKPIGEDYSKRTFGAYVDDQLIETKAKVNLKKTSEGFRSAQIEIDSHNGVVLLTGRVADETLRGIATTTVEKIRKVRRVNNELSISPPRSFTTAITDAWLGSKVKTRLLFAKDIDSGRVKVVINDGVVYLMGLVTQAEADKIVATVKETYGLQKIVRVFEYLE